MEYIHRWIQLEVVRGHSISAGYQASLDRSIGNLGAGGLLHNIYARLEALTVTDPASENKSTALFFGVTGTSEFHSLSWSCRVRTTGAHETISYIIPDKQQEQAQKDQHFGNVSLQHGFHQGFASHCCRAPQKVTRKTKHYRTRLDIDRVSCQTKHRISNSSTE